MIRRTTLTIAAFAFGLIACSALAQHGASDALGPQAQGFGNVQDALGPFYRENPYAERAAKRPSRHDKTPLGMTKHWNEVAIDASGLDHTPVANGEARVFGEQLGPARASRAMAIMHIAIFEAVNAISAAFEKFMGQAMAVSAVS